MTGFIITQLCTRCGHGHSPGMDTCPRCGFNPGWRPDANYVMKTCDGYSGRDCSNRVLWPEDDDIVLCNECSDALMDEVHQNWERLEREMGR